MTTYQRRQNNLALSLADIAVAYGYSYTTVKKMGQMPGFPILCGKVLPSDFDDWRRRQVGLGALEASAPRSRTAPRPQPDGAGTSDAPARKHDSPTAWPPRAARLLDKVS